MLCDHSSLRSTVFFSQSVCSILFYFIFMLVTVAKFLDTMLNKRDKSSHPCLVLDIAGKALTMDISCRVFLVHAVNQAEAVLLYS